MTAPKRIQFNRFDGKPLPPNTKLVTRGTRWGNPFKIGVPVGRGSDLWPYLAMTFVGRIRPDINAITLPSAERVIAAYRYWLRDQPELLRAVRAELRGFDLACACKVGEPCHGDDLLALANESEDD